MAALALGWLLTVSAAWADDKTPAREAAPSPTMELPARVETRHSIALAGRQLDYRAIAETIGLTTLKGEPTASLFTVSYLVDPPAGQQRPVAFVFNGGPGAASVFLHLGALGPRILDMPADGSVPNPPFRLVDNPQTWLAFSDLVFVDPVGTGFSRGKGKEENPDKPYMNVQGDLNSLGAVVRHWLTRHQRWGARVFLVGESYGGLRAAAMSESVEKEDGVRVSGMVLISPALDPQILHPDVTDLLAPAFELPSFAASGAALSGKADPAEAGVAAEHFALSDYLTGLAALKGIPAPGDPFIARVAATIGLPEDVVRRARGQIGARDFAHELRRGQGQIVSLYDATVARGSAADPWDDHAGDPVLDPAIAAYTAAFENYAADALGYHTEQPYYVLSHEVSRQWNWDGARAGDNGLGVALSGLQNTLLAHPDTRLLIANGRYDLVTPYLGSRWLSDQLSIPAAACERIRLRVYEGGHMMYMRPQSRAALASDAADLFAPEAATPRQ
ncbi:MAG TPA: septum formation initiator [Stellaceae bacterium]|jgi:carboxypeptidase C (cathepsin A)|nr:septum formation initiator [Stellaceae bacterium]